MKAFLVSDGRLTLSERPAPIPRRGEVLVRIRAVGVNRADLLQIEGKYSSPVGWESWPGLECSGVVEALGKDVKGIEVGDRVCALVGGGAYAEQIAVPHGLVFSLPRGMTFEEGAALPEAFTTAWLGLVREGDLHEGQTVYIAAGTSGLASAAIPLAKRLGAYVLTDIRREESKKYMKELSADEVTSRNELSAAFERLEKENRPVALALDCLGGEEMGKAIAHMAQGGTWIALSTLAGTETVLPIREVLQRGLTIKGSLLRKRSVEEKSEILQEMYRNLISDFERGIPVENAGVSLRIRLGHGAVKNTTSFFLENIYET